MIATYLSYKTGFAHLKTTHHADLGNTAKTMIGLNFMKLGIAWIMRCIATT